MPRKDGCEVSRKIKQTEGLESIPVVILTTRNNEADIAISDWHHASGYIPKNE
ncbi:Response regulator rcp1 [Roseimaritima multifibrata]|uniref:Response regulator rcp1 n=2 Tax=Roseimaritima multifibrata TaxID=1930274 RepID=A0A517MCP1_9BACT|nr:Response regulator rcp1 [Roseimaritima multifibrata]